MLNIASLFFIFLVAFNACVTRSVGPEGVSKTDLESANQGALLSPDTSDLPIRETYLDLLLYARSRGGAGSQGFGDFTFQESQELLKKMAQELMKAKELIHIQGPEKPTLLAGLTEVRKVFPGKQKLPESVYYSYYPYSGRTPNKARMETFADQLRSAADSNVSYLEFWDLAIEFFRACEGYLEDHDANDLAAFKELLALSPVAFATPVYRKLEVVDFLKIRPYPMYFFELTCRITPADGRFLGPIGFFKHDINHTTSMLTSDIHWFLKPHSEGGLMPEGFSHSPQGQKPSQEDKLAQQAANAIALFANDINESQVRAILNEHHAYYLEVRDAVWHLKDKKTGWNPRWARQAFEFFHENDAPSFVPTANKKYQLKRIRQMRGKYYDFPTE